MFASKQVGMNKVRQILLATQHYASVNNDYLPNSLGRPPAAGRSVSEALGPYLDALSVPSQGGMNSWRLPSDPSLSRPPQASGAPLPVGAANFPGDGASSLAINPMVYAPNNRLSSSITDGQSNTIAITEHYGVCGPSTFVWSLIHVVCVDGSSGKIIQCVGAPEHRPTFADAGFDDVVPVTTVRDSIATSAGSRSMTFQVRPPISECDPRVPQSSFPGGILVGFVDGSVRFIPSGINHSIFWGAVTPNRGEIIAFD